MDLWHIRIGQMSLIVRFGLLASSWSKPNAFEKKKKKKTVITNVRCFSYFFNSIFKYQQCHLYVTSISCTKQNSPQSFQKSKVYANIINEYLAYTIEIKVHSTCSLVWAGSNFGCTNGKLVYRITLWLSIDVSITNIRSLEGKKIYRWFNIDILFLLQELL